MADMKKVSDLPDDIVQDILLRLSAKPLIQFKLVSKAWCKLISSSEFANKHLKRGAKLKAMLKFFADAKTRCAVADYDTLDEHAEMLDLPLDGHMRIWNSCNGLFLISRPICIWNPTTGRSHILPNLEELDKLREFSLIFCYGLGYDFVTSCFKVLHARAARHGGCYWTLYTQHTNSWRMLNDVPYIIHCFGMICLENALHMLVSRVASIPSFDISFNESKVILAFDLSNEEFREVPLPDDGDHEFSTVVDDTHGCLSLVTGRLTWMINVWVMKEYGAIESWTKMFTINRKIICRDSSLILVPMYLLETGKIVVSASSLSTDDESYLIIYDSLKKTTKTLKGVTGVNPDSTRMYVESLVTFNIDGTQVQEKAEAKGRSKKEKLFEVILSNSE